MSTNLTRDDTQHELLQCVDPFGHLIPVPSSAVITAPAVYGILIESQRVLLQPMPDTHLWQLPGGIVDQTQSPKQALRQFFRASTGTTPTIGQLVNISERLIYTGEHGYKLSVLYFLLSRPTSGIQRLIDHDSEAQPEWVKIASLTADEMQFGFNAIKSASQIWSS